MNIAVVMMVSAFAFESDRVSRGQPMPQVNTTPGQHYPGDSVGDSQFIDLLKH